MKTRLGTWIAALSAVSCFLFWSAVSASAAIGPGEVVVSAGGVLHIVNPTTGIDRPLGDGALLTAPRAIAFAPDGSLVVGSPSGLVRIDPVTEHETPIAAGDYQGALTVEADGNILATRSDGLFRVDPGTGAATLLAAVSIAFRPSCLGVATDGTIFASDDGIDGSGAVFAVDPVTGTPSAIPLDINDTGTCLTVDRDDRVIVTNVTQNRMWNVDPAVPVATPIPLATAQFNSPYRLAAADTGLLYVDSRPASLLTVVVAELDPETGSESVFLDLGANLQIFGIAVAQGPAPGPVEVPAISTLGLGALALLLLGFAARAMRRTKAAPTR